MARRNYIINRAGYDKMLAEGRGKGRGANYIPFLQLPDFPSSGCVHRSRGSITGRMHTTFSTIENNQLLVFDSDPSVVDIREQFPLPLDETQRIATELKCKHPRHPGSDTDKIMTTDFLVTKNVNGKHKDFAYSVKPSWQAENKRAKEKLEIERQYWEKKGIPFETFTEKNISKTRARNLKWLRYHRDVELAQNIFNKQIKLCALRLLIEVFEPEAPTRALSNVCMALDNDTGVKSGTHLFVARTLFAIGYLETDLDKGEIWRLPMEEFELGPMARKEVIA